MTDRIAETAWVVERGDPGCFGPIYYTGYIPISMAGWSEDNADAIRFARKVDAQRMAVRLSEHWPGCRACEHMWIDAATTQEG